MKLLLVTLCLTLSSCSLVQLLPSTDCEHIKYERVLNHVTFSGECEV